MNKFLRFARKLWQYPTQISVWRQYVLDYETSLGRLFDKIREIHVCHLVRAMSSQRKPELVIFNKKEKYANFIRFVFWFHRLGCSFLLPVKYSNKERFLLGSLLLQNMLNPKASPYEWYDGCKVHEKIDRHQHLDHTKKIWEKNIWCQRKSCDMPIWR